MYRPIYCVFSYLVRSPAKHSAAVCLALLCNAAAEPSPSPVPNATPQKQFNLTGPADFSFNSVSRYSAIQGFFSDDREKICITPLFVLEGSSENGVRRLSVSALQENNTNQGKRYFYSIFLDINPGPLIAEMADELAAAAKSADSAYALSKYRNAIPGIIVYPFLSNFSVEQVVPGGLSPDFSRVSITDAQAFPSRQIITSRLYVNNDEAQADRQKYRSGAIAQFTVKASLFATVQQSQSSVSSQQVSIKSSSAFTELDGKAPAFKLSNGPGAITLGSSQIALTRRQKQEFQGRLAQEIKEKYHIQNEADIQFLDSRLEAALNKVTTPKDIESDFGNQLTGLRAYGFDPSDLKPEQIDKLVAQVKDFLKESGGSSFSADASASYLGIGGSAGMSKSEVYDKMKDAGWNFELQGSVSVPKSLSIYVLDKTALESSQNVTISITRSTGDSVPLQTTINSENVYVQNSSTLQDVGTIIPSVMAYDTSSDEWKESYAPCDGRDLPDTSLYVIARRKVIAAGKGWPGEINSQTNKVRSPDVRGVFLRGLNQFAIDAGSNGFDPEPNRTAGSFQRDAFKKHTHLNSGEISGFQGGTDGVASMHRLDGSYAQTNGVFNTLDAATPDGIVADSETRPKNVAVYYYLKIN